MRTISTYDFRNKLSDYINQVCSQETPILIGRFGKPLVKVIPYKKKDGDFMKYFGFMGSGEDGEAFVNRVRRNKYEAARVKKLRNGNVLSIY